MSLQINRRQLMQMLLATIVFVQGCASTPNTFSNSAPGTDFSSYSTFGFLDVLSTDKQNYESMETNFLKVAVAQEMEPAEQTLPNDYWGN